MKAARAIIFTSVTSVILCVIFTVPSVCGVHTTRIAAAQEPLSVGYVRFVVSPDGCSVWDGEVCAEYGYNIGASSRAWVVWWLDSIPDAAHVDSAEIELYLFPYDGPYEPDHQTQYRRVTFHPWAVPDCEDLYDLLQGDVYTQHSTGDLEGLQRHVLGGSAAADLEYQLLHGDWFCVAVTGEPSRMGMGEFSGWGAGGPDLIVTWEDGNPVEATAWGRIKALYRP